MILLWGIINALLLGERVMLAIKKKNIKFLSPMKMSVYRLSIIGDLTNQELENSISFVRSLVSIWAIYSELISILAIILINQSWFLPIGIIYICITGMRYEEMYRCMDGSCKDSFLIEDVLLYLYECFFMALIIYLFK